VTTDRERVLSEFIDAWNAGRRPDVDAFLERVPEAERTPLADEIASFLTWAPTPDYDDATLEQIAAEPIVREAFAATEQQAGLWPSLLPRLRKRAAVTTRQLAAGLVQALRLPAGSEGKTEAYLERMEHGALDPAGVSRRLLEGLARVLGVPTDELEGAGDLGLRHSRAAPAAAFFRAEDHAAEAVREDLEVFADALAAPPSEPWDEVDELFRGGR
jgi:hypothetical protein